MQNLRKTGDEQFEAQRFACDQAGRDAQTLDVLNVLYVVKQMLADERYEDAKRVVADYRASKQVAA